MSKQFRCIVIGCGGIGSAAAYWLARRCGSEVLALEQFELGHHRGGSQDHSRVIRLIYHHEDYTRLTPSMFTAWEEVEAESAVKLVHLTGGISFAERGSAFEQDIEVYARAMDAAGIAYERVDGEEIRRQFPQFRFPRPVDALIQNKTGLVDAAKAVAAHLALARARGAAVMAQCPVRAIHRRNGHIEVVTDAGSFEAQRLVVTAGAWTNELLKSLGIALPLTVTLEQVTYYATPHLKEFSIGRFPVFIAHDRPVYYGFPVYGEVATKIGLDASGPAVDPRTRTFDPDPQREQVARQWLEERIPRFLGPKLYSKTCLYTMPPDRNFVVDVLPGEPRIAVCIGAGHAYKFASLLGKILSQLVLDGRSTEPIKPFTLQRPALTDPSFEPVFHI